MSIVSDWLIRMCEEYSFNDGQKYLITHVCDEWNENLIDDKIHHLGGAKDCVAMLNSIKIPQDAQKMLEDILQLMQKEIDEKEQSIKKDRERARKAREEREKRNKETFYSWDRRADSYRYQPFDFDPDTFIHTMADFMRAAYGQKEDAPSSEPKYNLTSPDTVRLGLTAPFTKKQAKDAYLNLMKKHHPDNGGSKEAAQNINSAYANLKKRMT